LESSNKNLTIREKGELEGKLSQNRRRGKSGVAFGSCERKKT